MMKVFIHNRNNLIIILVSVFLSLNTSCTKKLQPEFSSGNIKRQSDHPNIKNPSESTVIERDPENQNVINQPEKTVNLNNSVAEIRLDTHKTNAQEIIRTAEQYFGVPHCMGGTTRKCMDCSGLLVTVFAEHDIKLPHNAQDQAAYGSKITSMDDLKEGDLVFFTRTYNTKNYITHSGIYIGNNNFIHTSSNTGVSITSLNQKYWKEKFVFGKRILVP